MPKTCSRVWKDLRRVFKSYGCQNHQLFERVDEPLPIRWTPSAEPPSKKPKHGPGRLQKVQSPTDLILPPSPLPATWVHLHHLACASLWLCPVRAILYTWLTSLCGMDDLYDATLECARGKFFPIWRKIRNYRFGIFKFDAELEWCKFRALTVVLRNNQCHHVKAVSFGICERIWEKGPLRTEDEFSFLIAHNFKAVIVTSLKQGIDILRSLHYTCCKFRAPPWVWQL